MSEEEKINKAVLIKASLNVLSNMYYMLGIVN